MAYSSYNGVIDPEQTGLVIPNNDTDPINNNPDTVPIIKEKPPIMDVLKALNRYTIEHGPITPNKD